MMDLSQERVIVTGGGGFLGRFVLQELRSCGVDEKNLIVPRRAQYDLTSEEEVQRL